MTVGYGKICLLILTIKSAVVLIAHIEQPRSVVFDEVHYGTICNLYKEGQFHIEDEPPFARMLLCFFLPDHVKGSHQIWKKIGQDFPHDFPLWKARFLPVIFGILLPIAAYHLILAMKFSEFAAVVAAFLIVFDNALTVQSKLFVPDSIILFLQTFSLCLALHPGIWSMLASFVMVGLAVASHSSSLVALFLVCAINAHREWKAMINPNIPLKDAALKATTRMFLSLCIPIAVYFLVFWIHFSSLQSSGPHNHLLSSAFQATLSNGLQTHSKDVSYGRHITLRSRSKGCYLTSSVKNYEALYKDGRRSSQQQVVSCVDHRQSRNWWLLSHPRELTPEDNKLFDGSKIRIIHSHTQKELNTDNVAAPKTPTKQEVSCSLDDLDNAIEPTWKVDVVYSSGYESWVTLYTVVRLYHCETKSLLSVTGKKISDGHFEVVSDPDPFNWNHGDGEWVAEEIFLEDFQSPYEFMEPVYMSYWDKLIEVHGISTMAESTADHRYASSPFTWPFAQTSIAYWYKFTTGAQIHLTGNPVSWTAGVLAGLILGAVLCVWALRMQRQIISVSEELWDRTVYVFALLGGGWMVHMIWLATADRPLFLYSYLPPLIYKHLLHACAAEIISVICYRSVVVAYFGVLLSIAYTYEVLMPLSLGLALEEVSQIEHLQWWETWDLLDH